MADPVAPEVVVTKASPDASAVAAVVSKPASSPAPAPASQAAVAHGLAAELETKLRCLKDGVIRWDERMAAKMHALVVELKSKL